MITSDKIAQAFAITNGQPKDEFRFGTVTSVNADGSVYVRMSETSITRCSCLYSASVGDRVQVCIKANGSCVVIGSVGESELDRKIGTLETNVSKLTPTVLYDNNSGTNGTVTLSDSAANYTLFEIYYHTDDGVNCVDYTKVSNPDGKNAQANTTNTNGTTMWHKVRMLSIVGSSITTEGGKNFGHWTFNPAAFNSINAIFVTKVIGYR